MNKKLKEFHIPSTSIFNILTDHGAVFFDVNVYHGHGHLAYLEDDRIATPVGGYSFWQYREGHVVDDSAGFIGSYVSNGETVYVFRRVTT